MAHTFHRWQRIVTTASSLVWRCAECGREMRSMRENGGARPGAGRPPEETAEQIDRAFVAAKVRQQWVRRVSS